MITASDFGPQDVERFWAKVDKRGPDECWKWSGVRHERGYGFFTLKTKSIRATQASLILDGRFKPSPRHVACHRCDNPPCVNPGHLWWGTPKENLQDASAKGRLHPPPRTHCKYGHELSGHNVTNWAGKPRGCRICCNELTKRRYRKKAISAAELADAANVWQPISTAPKDGRRIYLLSRVDGKAYTGYANSELNSGTFIAWCPLPAHGLEVVAALADAPAVLSIQTISGKGMREAAIAVGSALDDWIKLVGVDGQWTRPPTHDEAQEAMRANNVLAALVDQGERG